MATKKQAAVEQAPAVTTSSKPGHGYVERLVDTALARLMANGHRIDVAKIAAAATSGTPSPTAVAVHEQLAQLAAANPAIVLPTANRVDADVRYTLVQRRSLGTDANGAQAYRARSLRSDAATLAQQHIDAAGAVKPVRKARKPKA